MSMEFDKAQIDAQTYNCTTAELAVAIGTRHEAAVVVTINPNVPEKGRAPVEVAVVGLGVGQDMEARLKVLRVAYAAITRMIVDAEENAG